jgi:hypothetical protein
MTPTPPARTAQPEIRVQELRTVRVGDLIPNPENWREHPESQRSAFMEALDTVGFADAPKVWESPEGLMIIDGHLRAEALDPDALIPVQVLNVNEAEARYLLATYDPLALMAMANKERTEAIIAKALDAGKAGTEGIAARMRELVDASLLAAKTAAHDNDSMWQPATKTSSSTAIETVGFDLGSVWERPGQSDTRLYPWIEPLPALPTGNKNKGPLRVNYSRSPLQEMEKIVAAYMRPGDYFLEVCAGWFTFSSTAACWGYSGEGLDIWDVSLAFGRTQLARLPEGVGANVKVVDGDATAMPYEDDTFDFIYCNPPFFQLETYSDDKRDMAGYKTIEEWLAACGEMFKEIIRVARPGALVVTVMADARIKGRLLPLANRFMEAGTEAGLILHDIAIQHMLTSQLRMWRHAWNGRRTAKAHEYIITFQVPK